MIVDDNNIQINNNNNNSRSPIFCGTCGDMLDFQYIKNSKIKCLKCYSEIHIDEISNHIEQTHSKYNNHEDWVNKLEKTEDKLKKQQEQIRSTIRQDCEKCKSKYFYFHTMQLRGADEGSTVFYECTNKKCGHKYTLNN